MRARSRTSASITALAVLAASLAAALGAAPPASAATPAPNLTVDSLTATWKANSWVGSTGNPQPLPTTSADCGVWSGADGTQVVRLGNGDNLWTFGDTYLGPAVARQDFFNNSTVHNSMVRQNGSTFTTITGGTGCANGSSTTANPPVTPPSGAPAGTVDWPASSIAHGADLVKFYYLADASSLAQKGPEVVKLPQSDFESGNTVAATSTSLDGCLSSPIEWGAATVTATTNGTAYTYIYGSQQTSGNLYLARTSGDPGDQSTWSYYTGGTSFTAGLCGSLPLAALGGLQVATEFSVTVVNGNFWLVQEDIAGTYKGWAVAHEATSPWSFSSATTAEAALFQPGITTFPSIDDSFPGIVEGYAVRMMDPAAVTASTAGDVVVAYNVNTRTKELDTGCMPLIDYDANVYRPRFIDVPIADLVTGLTGGAASSRAHAAAGHASTAGTPRSGVRPRAAGPVRLPGPPAHVVFPQALRALGDAQLRAQRAQAARTARTANSAAATWTYSPDAVPQGNSYWQTSCPTTPFAAVDPKVTFTTHPDGSVDLAWPYQGADVWYWVNWQDQTDNPGVWTRNQFWSEGPNADGWQNLPAAGLTPSDTKFIRLHFVPPGSANAGDKFNFWIQAFAAGDGSRTSPDSATTPTSSVTPAVPAPTGLAASVDPAGGGVTLTWNAIPTLPGESISYVVGYKPTTSSTWTYLRDFITPTADVKPLVNGTTYDFKVAAVNFTGQWPFSSVILATP